MSASLIVGVDPGRYGHGIVARTAEDAEVVRERVDNDAAAIDEPATGGRSPRHRSSTPVAE